MRNKDVIRFDIPVNDGPLVEKCNPAQDLEQYLPDFIDFTNLARNALVDFSFSCILL